MQVGTSARLTNTAYAALRLEDGRCALCGVPWDGVPWNCRSIGAGGVPPYVLFDGDVGRWFQRPGELWRIGCYSCVMADWLSARA